jgi:hypothetical protein
VAVGVRIETSVRFAEIAVGGVCAFFCKNRKNQQFLHGSWVLSASAPEEIRTPDPRIRSASWTELKFITNQKLGLQALDLSR